MKEPGTARARLLAVLATVAVIAAACSSTGSSAAPSAAASAAAPSAAASEAAPSAAASEAAPSAAAKPYKIGYSNGGGVGNGFREEQVCTAKAEALASGQVSELITIHRNTDAAGQLQDIRDLIAADVDAIVFNPNSPDALNPALDEAKAAGIPTVSVDAYVTDPDTYNLYNNQSRIRQARRQVAVRAARRQGQRLVHPRHRRATRRTATATSASRRPSRTTRTSRSSRTPTASSPDWDPATATQLANEFISSGAYDNVQGIWTSGMDSQVVDAIKAADKPYVPIVGADLGAFVDQLLDPTDYPGLDGRCRDQHRRRRWRGRQPGAQAPERRDGHDRPVGQPAEHRPPEAGPRGQLDRRGQGPAAVVAGRRPRPALAARSPDRGLHHVHARAGRRLQGPGRVARPAPEPCGGAGSAGALRTSNHEDR